MTYGVEIFNALGNKTLSLDSRLSRIYNVISISVPASTSMPSYSIYLYYSSTYSVPEITDPSEWSAHIPPNLYYTSGIYLPYELLSLSIEVGLIRFTIGTRVYRPATDISIILTKV